jgi:hypothetical protein
MKFVVAMKVDGKPRSFGRFDDQEIARRVAESVRNDLHGVFAFHG